MHQRIHRPERQILEKLLTDLKATLHRHNSSGPRRISRQQDATHYTFTGRQRFESTILALAKTINCHYETIMARIKINLPEKFIFSTEIKPRITEINYGGHLGNDALLAIAHEVRARFLAVRQWSEMDINGRGLIMVDAAIMYLTEVFYGTTLHVELAVTDLSRIGCDFVFRLSAGGNGQEVARVKTGIAFFDYQQRKVVRMPEVFRKVVE